MNPTDEGMYGRSAIEGMRVTDVYGYHGVRTMPMMARALTATEACATARQFFTSQGSALANAPCDQLAAAVANDCTLYKGCDPIRLALTGTYACGGTTPPCGPAQQPPGGGVTPQPAPGAADNTVMIIAGLGVAALLGLAVLATTKKKTILIAPR